METAEIEVLVDELGERVERLRALYEQYFMGIEKIEPNVQRKDCDRRLWVLRREQIRNTGVRFKLNMVIQRYNTYQQYWQRITREIEAGTYKRDLRKVANRFGTEALTAQARKRFGKLIERTTDEAVVGSKRRPAHDDDDIDVEIDDFDSDEGSAVQPTAAPSHAADFGRIEHEADDMLTSAPEFGMLDVGESTQPFQRPQIPSRPRPAPPVPQGYARQSEEPAPRLPAFSTDRAPPPSEPPSWPSGAMRAPLPPVASPPVRKPALISALSAPVRRAPAQQKPAEPTPRPVRPSPSSPVTPHGSATPVTPAQPAVAHRPSEPSQTGAAPRPPPVAAALRPPRPSAAVRDAAVAPQAAAPQAAARQAAAPRPAQAPARTPPQRDAPESGIAPTRVRQLYESYVQARRACKESTSTITESGLADMLRASAEKLKGKHAGKDIDFDVVIRNGKAVLKPVIKG